MGIYYDHMRTATITQHQQPMVDQYGRPVLQQQPAAGQGSGQGYMQGAMGPPDPRDGYGGGYGGQR